MFKRHYLSVSLNKTPKHPECAETTESIPVDKIYTIVKSEAMNVALGVASLYAFKVAVDTTSQVLINRSSRPS